MKFQAMLQLHGKTATGITVPAEVVEALGGGKRPPVTVTFNGFSYRTTISPMGGQFLIPVSGERRTAAGAAAGDDLEVDVELDTAPRVVEVPADLTAAFADDPEARRIFVAMSFSHQNEYVTAIEGAKAAETRARRISSTISKLHASGK